jgi:hypothetical protein
MKQTAQGLASLGRGPDTELVHMTKGEVAGLQQLALAHGGSLTLNPHTGLAEAGFLSSILPMAIGFGLAPFTGGLSAAMIVGAGYTAATGSLKKGLMAGLGAYGGAGLAGGLSAAGAAAGAAEGVAGAGAEVATAAIPGTTAMPSAVTGTSSGALGSGSFVDPITQQSLGMQTSGMFPPNGQISSLPTATAMPALSTPPPQVQFSQVSPAPITMDNIKAGIGSLNSGTSAMNFAKANSGALLGIGAGFMGGMEPEKLDAPEANQGMIRPYTSNRTQVTPTDMIGANFVPGQNPDTSARQYFANNNQYTALTPYKAPGPEYMAAGGPVAAMSDANAIGANTGYPMANARSGAYATPTQVPISQNVITGAQDAAADPYTGQAQFAEGGDVSSGIIESLFAQAAPPQYQNGSVGGYDFNRDTGVFSRSPVVPPPMQEPSSRFRGGFDGIAEAMRNIGGMQSQPQYANGSVGGYTYDGNNQFTKQKAMAAGGGISTLGGKSDLGGYSDGGQLLRGPGDGVSDNIPAMIGGKQHARLADGEFVIPARIVSELGNGSTEAGSRQLYAMMARIQKSRRKSMGKGKIAVNTRAAKQLPA